MTTLQPVKHLSSRFTKTKDITLLSADSVSKPTKRNVAPYGFCISVSVFYRMLIIIKLLFSFQVLAVTLQPVKLSCSHFTTKMDIILSNWLSIKINNTQCITAPAADPLLVLVGILISTYQTTLWATQYRLLIAARHTPFPQDIQLVTVGFSLEPIISILQTLKCSTK